MTFQVAEVSRPLASVGDMCDKGNIVVFGAKGGYVLGLDGQSKVRFERNRGVYELDLWVKNEEEGSEASDFPRQGS